MHANHDSMGHIGGDNVEFSFFQGGESVGVSPGSPPLCTKDVIERVETGTICVLWNFIQSGFGLNFPPYHGNASLGLCFL